VVIVATHADKTTSQDQESIVASLKKKYCKKFPNIKAILSVSCQTREHIPDLLKEICRIAGQQPTMGEEVPLLYVKVEQWLKKHASRTTDGVPVIPWKEFVSTWQGMLGLSAEEEKLMRACDFLNDVGGLVHFSKHRYPDLKQLNDLVITDPQWLAQVFASLISPKHHFISGGVLRHRDLLQIWKKFPQSLIPALYALMQQFEICFPLLLNTTAPTPPETTPTTTTNQMRGSPYGVFRRK